MFAATCVLLSSLGHVLMSGTAVPRRAMAAAFAVTAAAGWILAGRERGLPAVISATVAVQAALHGGFSLAQAVADRFAGRLAVVPSAAGAVGASGTPGSPAAPDSAGGLVGRWVQYLLCSPPVLPPRPPAPGTGGGAGGHAQHAMHSVHALTDGAASMTVPVPSPAPMSMSMYTSMPTPMPMAGGHDMLSMSPLGMLAAHLLAALVCGLWLAYGERGAFRVLRAFAARILVPLRLFFRLPAPAHRPRVRCRRDHRARPLRNLLLADALTSRGPPLGTAVV
ncbi:MULTISPECIES: hypothetical protein [unclassified Streptomyces]|uniref:hypothetical protein n=1 Tax=unclassified Streptomyces TaxID=2593676 RepID=UPI000DC7599E|nr:MULTISPECIES: hypothetical protein [unclassified Streptomyces]AWZ04324.1 hypothetical protein DRB89_06420 [Streptomyces sp. ICC4]AWZ11961.1 hypothetical protein DRB96_06140 [Streptomyces sp. ICC1]